MTHEIKAYLESKIMAWSASTMKSESARLNAVAHLLDGNPLKLWDALQSSKPYTRKTTWIRVCQFWDFARPSTENPYRAWSEANALQFKNVYLSKKVGFTFEEARSRIERLPEPHRAQAMKLLTTGQRYVESFTSDGEYITGKGKKRRLDMSEGWTVPGMSASSYYRFWEVLGSVGLKPHDLRKLAATELHRAGMSDRDLMEVMGWSDIRTLQRYLQSSTDEVLKQQVKATLRRSKDGNEIPRKIPKAG